MYQKLQFKIRGVSPLLMHNGRLANPLDEAARAMKKVSSKRNKTEEDYMNLSKLEWHGSLYLQDGKPIIPSHVMEAVFITAARKRRLGKTAIAGILCEHNLPLIYEGPQTLEGLWEDENFRLIVGVRIKGSRIMRTRPKFDEWSAVIELLYEPTLLEEGQVVDIMSIAGSITGIGDWRPKFGRFVVESWERIE